MCCGFFREGQVSREEITAYFMRASVICSKLGLGFVHNFQETTYMKPTFCDNCSGFVRKHKPPWCCFLKKMSFAFCSFMFSHINVVLSLFSHSYGVSSSKATDAKVNMVLSLVQFWYLWPNVS